jgi:hypothetical protein
MRFLGTILVIGGLIAAAIFGYQAYQDTASVRVFGSDITVSSADWSPVIMSGIVAVVGLAILAFGKRK